MLLINLIRVAAIRPSIRDRAFYIVHHIIFLIEIRESLYESNFFKAQTHVVG